MNSRFYLVLVFLLWTFSLSAQVRVSTWDYDFGEVELWENQPAIFEITNTSSKELVFLPTFPDDDLYLWLPTKNLSPGETTELHAIYYTEKKGRFKRPFKIYTNLSSEPLEMSVRGKIELIDISARTICPGSQVAEKELLAIAEIKNRQAQLESKPMAPDIGDVMVRSFEKQHPELVAKEKLREKQREEQREEKEQATKTEEIAVEEIEEEVEEKIVEKEISKPEPARELVNEESPSDIEDDISAEEELVQVEKPSVPEAKSEPIPKPSSKPSFTDIVRSEDEFIPDVSSDEDLRDTLSDEKSDQPKEDINNSIASEENLNTIKETTEKEKVEEEQLAALQIEEKNAEVDTPEDVKEPITLNEKNYSANNVVFLIDVSTSMKDRDKLPLLKESMVQMTKVMRGIDKVTVITYSTKPDIALQPTSADKTEDIVMLIESLEASGRTNGVMGLQEAYRMIRQQFIAGGNNQIILATDGLFNQYHPDYTEKDLMSLVRSRAREDNIKVSVIGFGDDNKARRMMSRLASNGGGSFLKISPETTGSTLVDEIKKQSLKK